ncbi:MAG: DKNYY domain-containing protein [Crocinitomicaceae bacterium]|nr:DKNYY domain-containing protein [Crocinitomicaceae bacterium]
MSKNKPERWKKVGHLLYLNKEGDLAFLAHEGMNPDKHEGVGEDYITHFGWEDTTQLKNVIDIKSFKELNGNMYRDNNRIYFHYDMSDGGYFHIWTDDPADFKMMGNYILYKDSVYYPRNGKVNADFQTFKSSDKLGILGKDKDHFFVFGDTVSLEQLKQDISEEQLKMLMEL